MQRTLGAGMLLLGCRLAAKAESNRGPCPWSRERILCIPGLITRCSFLFWFVQCEPGVGSYPWKGWHRQYRQDPASHVRTSLSRRFRTCPELREQLFSAPT